MLFWKGDYINLEYTQRLKEHIEVLEAYNGGVLFSNSTVDTSQKIAKIVRDAEINWDMGKAQVSTRGKYLTTAFLISSDRHRYSEMILLLKNYYAKQQKNYPKTLTDMHGLMVAFKSTRPTPVSGGRNEGMNFRNVAVESGTGGDGYHGGNGVIGRKLECWRCGGEHMKRDYPKLT